MPRFKKSNFDQHMLVPVNLTEQLLPGTMEAVINDVIDRMDMKKFNERFKNEETGAPAYNPRILLKIILYAYSRGILSSRKIAEAAEKNITFIALSGYSKPDFTTIASFVSSMHDEISVVFLHVLRICDKMQLVGGERFAVDGHKLSSNAAKEWSGTHEALGKKIEKMKVLIESLTSAHKTTDSAEEKATLLRKRKKVQAKVDKVERFLASNEPKKPARKGAKEIQSNVTDNESAKIISAHGVIQGYNGIVVADAKNQIIVAAQAHGTNFEGEQLKDMLEQTKQNLTQVTGETTTLEDKQLLADANYFNEKNLRYLEQENIDAYIPDPMFRKRDPRFADADAHKGKTRKNVYDTSKKKNMRGFTQQDFTYHKDEDYFICRSGHRLNPWGEHKKSGGKIYGIEKKNYCAQCPLLAQCMPNAKASSRKTLTVDNGDAAFRRLPYSQKMKAKIDSPAGREIYSHRLGIVEPVFANTSAHKGMNKFTLRGRIKVNIQWTLFIIVHNLSKIVRAQQVLLAAQAA